MSSFFICSIACMARCDFSESGSLIISSKTSGTTCQETPNLSLSQPHCWALLIAAGGELLPVVVHFFLRLAIDLKRDGLVELEDRAAVERGECLPVQLEGHGHDRSGRLAVDLPPGFAVARDVPDLRVLEDADIERGGLLGLIVEPQDRGRFVGWLAWCFS